MTSHSMESTDGLGGEKIIYSHFSLKTTEIPFALPTALQGQPSASIGLPGISRLACCQTSRHMMDAKLL